MHYAMLDQFCVNMYWKYYFFLSVKGERRKGEKKKILCYEFKIAFDVPDVPDMMSSTRIRESCTDGDRS